MANLNYAGEYSVSELKLMSSSGNVVDLSRTYISLSLFEDIFKTSMTGIIVLTDSNNMLMNMPITGQEYLSLKIETPSLEEHASKPKVYYILSDEDLKSQLDFFKVIMRLELELHYKTLSVEEASANQSYKESILSEVTACTTGIQARELMHTKFGLATGHILPQENGWGETQVQLSQ